MAIGTLLVSTYRKFLSSRPRENDNESMIGPKPSAKEAVVVDEERAGLMENQDLPPAYEDAVAPAPAYEVHNEEKA
jgi:hypothetical protein